MTINRRNIIELAELTEDQDLEQSKESLNESITEINYVLRNLNLRNFDGEIITATLAAGATTRVPHKLSIVPKYRIILKQVGGGLVTDGEYTKEYIELINGGGSDAVVTIIIVKD